MTIRFSERLAGIASTRAIKAGVLGVSERAVVEEPVDGAEANVVGAGAVAAVGLEVLEERADHGRVELRELEPGW